MNNKDTLFTIKNDLRSQKGIIRFISNKSNNTSSRILRNIIVKYSPTAFVLEFDIFEEAGAPAILINFESSLAELIKKSNNIKLEKILNNHLKAHLQYGDTEIVGQPPIKEMFPVLLNSTLQQFCSQTVSTQNIVILLEFNEEIFAQKFLNFISPITNNMPERLKIYFFITTKTITSLNTHLQFNQDYYWDHPMELGLDLHFLTKASKSTLIEFLTTDEICILFRLWNLSDIAIPAYEVAINFIPKYKPLELKLLVQTRELGIKFNNQDRYHAEYKLHRELSYHYSRTGRTDKANKSLTKAVNTIEKSSLAKIEIIKLKGKIWGESAQLAKLENKLANAIRILQMQKALYKQNKYQLDSEISTNAYNLGVCFRDAGKYKDAIREVNLSIKIEQKLGKRNNELNARLELGRTYVDLNEIKSALLQFTQIENMLPSRPEGRMLYIKGITNAYLGYLKLLLEERQSALAHFVIADEIFTKLGAQQDKQNLHKLLNA